MTLNKRAPTKTQTPIPQILLFQAMTRPNITPHLDYTRFVFFMQHRFDTIFLSAKEHVFYKKMWGPYCTPKKTQEIFPHVPY